jgi:acetyl esterase/lipase
MISGMFKLIGVNKMLDKEGTEFERLLETYKEKQKKPLKIPYKKLTSDCIVDEKSIDGTKCYVVRKKNGNPKKAVLYLFGGGYILPPDPGDIVLCGQIAKNCDAEVWFPLYPMAPDHRLKETVRATYGVYQEILKIYDAENVRFFGTSSGGGLAMSMCMYIKHEHIDVALPGKLVLQSPGLQVPPSDSQMEEMEKRKSTDVMIPPRFFCNIAPVLATGEDAYLLSPILFDLTGFPPIDIFFGTREVMIAFLKDFQETCKKYDVSLKTHIGKGMMHCWGAMEFVPEAKAVRQEYFGALR